MASDWIKMSPGMSRRAKVTAMARFLCAQSEFNAWLHGDANVTRHDSVTNSVTFEIVTRVTVASLLDVWGAINHVIKDDDRVPFMALCDIDRIAGIPCFAQAMASVDWVYEDSAQGLVFPNFHEFNTPEAKRSKAKSGAQRAREYRERKKAEQGGETPRNDRHVTSRRVEESREEGNQPTRADAREDAGQQAAPAPAVSGQGLAFGEIVSVLDAHGVPFHLCHANHAQPKLKAWSAAGVTAADLATAVGRAHSRNRDGPLNPGFLDPFVKQAVSERTAPPDQRETHGKNHPRANGNRASERTASLLAIAQGDE